ncbi:hypothetical protein RQP46_000706 [Phenoliferia psychrophenolica]
MGILGGAGTRRCLAPVLVILATAFIALTVFLPTSGSTPRASRDALPSKDRARPAWHNYTSVDRASRPLDDGVFPLRLTHLDELRVEAPFSKLWLASAFVDSRPLVVKAAPEVTILAVGLSALADEMGWDKTPLVCYILLKQPGARGSVKHLLVPAYMTALPDSHTDAKIFTGLLVTCPLVGNGGEIVPWESAEIFVSLSMAADPPPPTAFIRAKALPRFDAEQHHLGVGPGAVCLQPLVGDTYASSMRDFVAYYRALGFTDFYAYLLDPGPETIAVLREMAHEPGFKPIRWTLPVEWLFSRKGYQVEPQNWEIPGLPLLSAEEEFHYGYSGSSPPKLDVAVWAFAQNVAHHDCSFRAKVAGSRWTAMVDWDEYLLLRPPSGVWPPPSRGHPKQSLLGDWAATFDEEAHTAKLPSAFLFQSSFTCILCQPSHPPTSTPEKLLGSLDLRRPTPAVPAIFVSPVRSAEWFQVGYRAKTIIDPWAWFCATIHQPVLSYAQYSNIRAVAWKASGTGDENWRVYSDIVRPSIGLVVPPQVTNTSSTLGPSEFATGAMYHLRADSKVASAVADWEAAADENRFDLFSSSEGGRLLSRVRATEDLWPQHMPVESAEGSIIEDWAIFDTMSSALVRMLEDRRAKPLRRWTGDRWVGSPSVDDAGPSLFLRTLLLLATAVAVLFLATRKIWS